MSKPIISVTNLGKCYQIGHERQQGYTALRDVIAQKAKDTYKSIFDRANRTITTTEDFWALKDVSFDINEGEAIGVIGRNGAGKSTLLKLLSRITEPTTGRIVLNGRVASLLEVGTGFHPELSGRENIYLNGSILGMSRKEIKAKFDEIVDFSGVEKFLDTPVKRYSSGMYVRLAFSVAAHMEPEILIVDEVLAVGDTEFQKKCLGKMGEISQQEGRTVIFVSHNIDAISNLTTSAMLLSKGEMRYYGSTGDAIEQYLQSGSNSNVYKKAESKSEIFFSEISTSDYGFVHNEPIEFKIIVHADKLTHNLIMGIGIYNLFDQYVGNVNIEKALNLNLGKNEFNIIIRNHNLVPGDYKGVFAVAQDKTYHIYDSVIGDPAFTVYNDSEDTYLLSKWNKQFGNHYFSDVQIIPI